MLYTSASASGSKLSATHYTGLTTRHLNGACKKAIVCAMPGWPWRLSLLLEAAEYKESQQGFTGLPQGGKPHITKGFEVHFSRKRKELAF